MRKVALCASPVPVCLCATFMYDRYYMSKAGNRIARCLMMNSLDFNIPKHDNMVKQSECI